MISEKVNEILSGKLNITKDITLDANETSTAISDPRIGTNSFVELMPLTSSAATSKASGIHFSDAGIGTITVNHASDAATDQDFKMIIIG